MAANFSPGPWKVVSAKFIGRDRVAFEVRMPEPQLAMADKHGIEALHDLYAALEGLGDVVGDTLCWCSEHAWDCDSEKCKAARAALAKANGGK
jgi:hypothetical protein